VQDQGVPGLIEQVHPIEGEPCENDAPVSPLNLDGVDVHHNGEERDHVPLEEVCIPQDLEGLLGSFGHPSL
jgi:hypothetical protein